MGDVCEAVSSKYDLHKVKPARIPVWTGEGLIEKLLATDEKIFFFFFGCSSGSS